jgi:protein-histidine pros-kinase
MWEREGLYPREGRMNLLIRINLTLGVVFALGGVLAVAASRAVVEANARSEVIAEANLMADSAMAMRTYTANEVSPLLGERMNSEFLPQSVPFYAATESFLRLKRTHPDFSYKEATLNPTNPRDRASDWEADLIQRFRNDAGTHELAGERETPMGGSLYVARPIRAEGQCLVCHSLPAAAPRTVIARYGSDNGFGWQPGEIVGAQIVSVPVTEAAARAHKLSVVLISWVIATFLVTLAVVDGVLYMLVVRPIRHVSQIADRLSLGDAGGADFPAGGASEIAGLGRSFDRMRKSLQKALKLLESAK